MANLKKILFAFFLVGLSSHAHPNNDPEDFLFSVLLEAIEKFELDKLFNPREKIPANDQHRQEILDAILFRAVESKLEKYIEPALKEGANPNIDKRKTSPLEMAVKQKNKPLVHLLLEYGADAEWGLSSAIDSGDLEVVELLLKHGADPQSGLYHLVWNYKNEGQVAIAQALLKNGAKDKDNQFLYHSIARAQIPLMNFFLDNGGDAISLRAVDPNIRPYVYAYFDIIIGDTSYYQLRREKYSDTQQALEARVTINRDLGCYKAYSGNQYSLNQLFTLTDNPDHTWIDWPRERRWSDRPH
jgi:ankyrin repeat protein